MIGFFCVAVYSQGEGTGELANTRLSATQNKAFFRWVFQPRFTPFLPLVNRQYDISDNRISIGKDRGFIYGMRFEKYFPNHRKGYGFDLELLSRETIFAEGNNIFLNESALSITPFFVLKKGAGKKLLAEKVRHPFLEFGLKGQFAVSSSLQYHDDDERLRNAENDLLRPFKLWAYVGLGIKKDVANHSNHRSGGTNLSIGLYVPMFGQSNQFKTKNTSFPTALDRFLKNRSFNTYLTLTYAQSLNIHKNEIFDHFPIPIRYETKQGKVEWEYPKNKEEQFLPPLVNFGIPRYATFGNFYLTGERQGGLDSIFVDVRGESYIYDVEPSAFKSFRFGYTLHAIGNYKNFINETKTKETIVLSDKGFRYNVFASLGLISRQYDLRGPREIARAYFLDAESSVGLRIGFSQIGLYFIGGYSYTLNLTKEFDRLGTSYDEFNFSNQRQDSFFAGIGYKNLFYVKVNAYQLEHYEELEIVPVRNFVLSMGFGF